MQLNLKLTQFNQQVVQHLDYEWLDYFMIISGVSSMLGIGGHCP